MNDMEHTERDEWDPRAFLEAILETRLVAAAACGVVAMLFWSAVAALTFISPPVQHYETRIDLIFSGAASGTYPNGTTFRIADIVAPVVLNEVYERQGLEQFIDREDFVNAVTASPHTPARELILQKYDLNARALSRAEVDELEIRLREELLEASSKGVVIRFSSSNSHTIPKERMESVMSAIPRSWNDHQINNLGVVSYAESMHSRNSVDRELIENVDYLIGFEIVQNLVNLVLENIDAVERVPNGLVIVDPVSDSSTADLRRSVVNIQDYRLGPLRTAVENYGIARDRVLVELFFRAKIEEKTRYIGVLEEQLENIRTTYAEYMAVHDSNNRDLSTAANGSMIPQVGAEFLDRIIDITNAGLDIEFRQSLKRSQLDISNAMATEKSEIIRLENMLAYIASPDADDSTKFSMRKYYTDKVIEEMPFILDELEAMFDVSNRLMEVLALEQLGSDEILYRQADGDVDAGREGSMLSVRNLEYFMAVMLLTVFIVVLIRMVWQWRSRGLEA